MLRRRRGSPVLERIENVRQEILKLREDVERLKVFVETGNYCFDKIKSEYPTVIPRSNNNETGSP
jgi:hypothetical protein